MTFCAYLFKAVQDEAQQAAGGAACSWWCGGPARRASVSVLPFRCGGWPGCCFAGRPPRRKGPRSGVDPGRDAVRDLRGHDRKRRRSRARRLRSGASGRSVGRGVPPGRGGIVTGRQRRAKPGATGQRARLPSPASACQRWGKLIVL